VTVVAYSDIRALARGDTKGISKRGVRFDMVEVINFARVSRSKLSEVGLASGSKFLGEKELTAPSVAKLVLGVKGYDSAIKMERKADARKRDWNMTRFRIPKPLSPSYTLAICKCGAGYTVMSITERLGLPSACAFISVQLNWKGNPCFENRRTDLGCRRYRRPLQGISRRQTYGDIMVGLSNR